MSQNKGDRESGKGDDAGAYVNAIITGGKPRNYHEIVLTQICSQATSGTRRGSFQAENWIKKGWCHVHFCFILQLRTNNGEIRQCSSV